MATFMSSEKENSIQFKPLGGYLIGLMSLDTLKSNRDELLKMRRQQQSKITVLQNDFDRLKQEVSAMKEMLNQMTANNRPMHQISSKQEKLRSKQEQLLSLFQEKTPIVMLIADIDNDIKLLSKQINETELGIKRLRANTAAQGWDEQKQA